MAGSSCIGDQYGTTLGVLFGGYEAYFTLVDVNDIDALSGVLLCVGVDRLVFECCSCVLDEEWVGAQAAVEGGLGGGWEGQCGGLVEVNVCLLDGVDECVAVA